MDTASDKALQRFAELMIEKIKQVEDNWQKPWFGIKGGGLPQNIEGRTYNGVNSFMLFLLSEKEQYSLPVYMTFMQAKDNGLNILKGEKSFPVIYWNFSVRDKNGKKIPFDVYKNLDKNEQQEYKVTPFLKTYNVFNVQQTNLQETKPEKWEALKEQFKIPAIKDEQGMLTVPLIDAMVREQQWICPIYSKEGNSAYHARGEDNHIVVPLKGQFKDGENFYSTLLHEMAHSTGEPEHLNREKGVIFGDKQYAKEELVAELTSATVGQCHVSKKLAGSLERRSQIHLQHPCRCRKSQQYDSGTYRTDGTVPHTGGTVHAGRPARQPSGIGADEKRRFYPFITVIGKCCGKPSYSRQP